MTILSVRVILIKLTNQNRIENTIKSFGNPFHLMESEKHLSPKSLVKKVFLAVGTPIDYSLQSETR
jgi:hypothetical protein